MVWVLSLVNCSPTEPKTTLYRGVCCFDYNLIAEIIHGFWVTLGLVNYKLVTPELWNLGHAGASQLQISDSLTIYVRLRECPINSQFEA